MRTLSLKRWSGAPLAAAAAFLCSLVGAAVSRDPGFNRWDNFEYFSILYWKIHSLWLAGQVPWWNQHQFLGEPLLANAQSAAFYPPHTVAVALLRAFGGGPGDLAACVALLHIPWMAAGWHLLLESLGVRRVLALAGAVSLACCGYFAVLGMVWMHMLPAYAWLPWVLLGVWTALEHGVTLGRSALIAAGLACAAAAGHPQQTVYIWLHVLAFAAAAAWTGWSAGRRGRLARLALALALAGGASLLLLLAPLRMLAETARPHGLSPEDVLVHAALPRSFVGMILPLFRVANGFIANDTSIFLFAGGWVVPALLAAAALFVRVKEARWRRLALGWAGMGAFFTLLSLGPWGVLYPLTLGIPVWRDFRWPHKLLPHVVACWVVLAALSLERLLRHAETLTREERIAASALPCGLACLGLAFLGSPLLASPGGVLSFLGGLACLGLTAWCHRPRPQAVWTAAVLAGAVGTVALAHDLPLKGYAESYGGAPAWVAMIDRAYRVLPVSSEHLDSRTRRLRPFARYHAATLDGYLSATGHSPGLLPRWYMASLGADASGVLEQGRLDRLVGTRFLDQLGVRYLVADKRDLRNLVTLGLKGLKRLYDGADAAVFENPRALPRLFFATAVGAYSPASFEAQLLRPSDGRRPALLDGWILPAASLPQAVATSFLSPEERSLEAKVFAPKGGILVMSQTWYPGWKAWADGRPLRVRRANETLCAVEVPAGAKRVVFRYGL
ncbi:MAG: hypothetical protein HY927_01780 [Elusimicrobia bacterium]|nr:hypothetical protein [Elusimicrobiota bacterium]